MAGDRQHIVALDKGPLRDEKHLLLAGLVGTGGGALKGGVLVTVGRRHEIAVHEGAETIIEGQAKKEVTGSRQLSGIEPDHLADRKAGIAITHVVEDGRIIVVAVAETGLARFPAGIIKVRELPGIGRVGESRGTTAVTPGL